MQHNLWHQDWFFKRFDLLSNFRPFTNLMFTLSAGSSSWSKMTGATTREVRTYIFTCKPPHLDSQVSTWWPPDVSTRGFRCKDTSAPKRLGVTDSMWLPATCSPVFLISQGETSCSFMVTLNNTGVPVPVLLGHLPGLFHRPLVELGRLLWKTEPSFWRLGPAHCFLWSSLGL